MNKPLNIDEFCKYHTYKPNKYKKSPKKIEYSSEKTATEIPCESQKKQLEKKKKYPQFQVELYEKIKAFRQKNNQTPVDLLGAQQQGDISLPQNDFQFQLLISILLSVQTKDEITDQVMKKVEKNKITIQKINQMSESQILQIIQEVNFNQKKATFIKNAAKIITEQFQGQVPDKYEDLIQIKGIGPKVAHLFLQIAQQKNIRNCC
ncbi:hypothetical protein IMG5_058000 [Ichthyophthirius multifiliis]|uniref:HhH-GPD domain-containing protein n=1 Tax=Ichthyophthirius multifiliis TaxID=5932 RepID=G0QNF6_ICHMU|nr:hypothetical protein IMG5_058000 [Ichthyophthirius multifiliis]EGR33245.1 hypothetical protein IMG5_058000 [Ichthyophthirius multifiliis]|eukprot:XP_004037231.1 hypothetical protein IMG5_058000 [Ichthyophthirius multifiliis]